MISIRSIFSLGFSVLLAVSPAFAQKKAQAKQEAPAQSQAPQLIIDELQARIQQLTDSKDVPEAVKTKAIENYKHALDEISLRNDWGTRRQGYEKDRAAAPEEMRKLQKDLATPPPEPGISPPAETPIAQLEQLQTRAEAELNAVRQELAQWEAEPEKRAKRKVTLAETMAGVRERLDQATKDYDTPPNGSDPADVAASQRSVKIARKRAIEEELKTNDAELQFLDATNDLIELRKQMAQRKVAIGEKLLKAWDDLINERRRAEAAAAAQKAEEAQQEAMNAHPAIRQRLGELADENAALAKRNAELADKIQQASQDRDSVAAEVVKLKDTKDKIDKKIKIAGLSNAVGFSLRQQRQELPNLRIHRRKQKATQNEIQAVQFEMVDLNDRVSASADVEKAAKDILSALDPNLPKEQRKIIETGVRDLLQTNRKSLLDLKAYFAAYEDKMIDLLSAESKLIADTQKQLDFIDENVLWIRSSTNEKLPQKFATSIQWFLDPASWTVLTESLEHDYHTQKTLLTSAVLIFLILLVLQRRIRIRLRGIGEDVFKARSDAFSDTVEAALLTLMISLLWPGLMWLVGWRRCRESSR